MTDIDPKALEFMLGFYALVKKTGYTITCDSTDEGPVAMDMCDGFNGYDFENAARDIALATDMRSGVPYRDLEKAAEEALREGGMDEQS